jgi:spore coat protein U-like protein
MRRKTRFLKVIVLAAFALLCAATSASAIPIFTITVNTSSIAGTVGDIDFNFGGAFNSPDVTALISMWSSNGTLSGVPATSGSTSGVLPANVTMKVIGGSGSDYFHDFTFGTFLTFNLALTYDSAIPGTFTTDDTWGLALYDSMVMPLLANGSLGDFIFSVDMHPNGTYTLHDASTSGQLTVSSVPEPSTLTLFGFGLLAAAIPIYRRRIRAAHHRSET